MKMTLTKGRTCSCKRERKGSSTSQQELAPTGQSEHGGSSHQSSAVEEHQKGSQQSDHTLQCKIYQHQPGGRSRERDCEAQSP
jgi:hypothetical protein